MTGNFTDWNGNMVDIGPLYPFVGAEMLMVIVLIAIWIGWHVIQMRAESRDHEEDARLLRQGDNLHRVIQEEHTLERM